MQLHDQINPDVLQVLEEVKSILKKIYGDSLVDVILYGSYARGEERATSDIDIAVLLRGKIRPYEELTIIIDATYEVELDNDLVFNFHPISEKAYSSSTFSFYESIKNEGISI